MNYLREDVLEPLVGRYVVGTMSRRARRRFDALFEEHESVRASVYRLERTLLPMTWSLPDVKPSELVWRRIARDIGFGKTPAEPKRRGTLMPLLAAGLALAVLATSLGWWRQLQRPPETVIETVVQTETVTVEPEVAVINDENGNALWVALVYQNLGRVDIDVTTAPDPQTANDYQLWILAGDGTPASMGLLPQAGEASLTLDANAVAALGTGNTLAVSLEPLGGSPQPVPTGPVLYTAPLLLR